MSIFDFLNLTEKNLYLESSINSLYFEYKICICHRNLEKMLIVQPKIL